MLSLALGEGGDVGSGVGGGESSFSSDPASLALSQSPSAAAAALEQTGGSQSLDALRREISLARRSLPTASAGSTTGQRRQEQQEQQQQEPQPLLVFTGSSAAERELARAAAGMTAEFDSVGGQGHALSRGVDSFFRAWADRCGRLTVPLEQMVDGDSSRRSGGGAPGKDDRCSAWYRVLRARSLAFCPYPETLCSLFPILPNKLSRAREKASP